ncbi:hypothetical protein CIK52_13915 [Kocuria rosea]|nr:hypothetical protein CIK52_13915 [Kocuria rosea]QCY34404.1 DUF4365 domain-containing protein [Kocuria rosea]
MYRKSRGIARVACGELHAATHKSRDYGCPMAGETGAGLTNRLQGDFGELWVEVVATALDLGAAPSDRSDLHKSDLTLTHYGEIDGYDAPSVKVQVKTEVEVPTNDNGDLRYALDADTHRVLCKRSAVRRILVVVNMPSRHERIQFTDEGTLLRGKAHWISLEDAPPSENKESQTVLIPAENSLDEQGLRHIMRTYGVPRTTKAPPVDIWEGQS